MSNLAFTKGISSVFYPEKRSSQETKLDAKIISAFGNATRWVRARPKFFEGIVKPVDEIGETLKNLNEEDLKSQVDILRFSVKDSGLKFELVARSFALTREFARRRIGMEHFGVQLIGGWVLLNGMVAEMETGEGKTLTATLPACAAAMAGIPVHVITVNDYLARRDAEWMKPIYEAFGLSVGVITHGMSSESRQNAYRCDITYCTNKEVVFDYLKDRILLGQNSGYLQMRLERLYRDSRLERLLLRGLCFAIIDEADSILIDEARTPLIISGPVDSTFESKIYHQAIELSDQLEEDNDFTLDMVKRTVELTDLGKEHIKELSSPIGSFWTGKRRREELLHQALTARYLFSCDRDYIVQNNKVQIVDEYTGRVMADRSWERGLHQLIEAKEGCDITVQNETLARISYQRFFRRYHHLAGMTGTAREVANELWSVYRLIVIPIPPNRPLIRIACPFRFYRSAEEKWREIVKKIDDVHKQGRPVLIGTRSVATSEQISKLLEKAGLTHRVLNARQDKEEADIIAHAGQKLQITIATNMAGRGTDIKLGPGVAELGGLHVLATELHDAKRIDRQLFGRCGRQGDPGSYEAIVSLEDDLFNGYRDRVLGRIVSQQVNPDSTFGQRLGKMYSRYVQYSHQKKYFHMRRDLLKFDESLENAMAFSGRGE
jgi:preprotein translocase subunit SecA